MTLGVGGRGEYKRRWLQKMEEQKGKKMKERLCQRTILGPCAPKFESASGGEMNAARGKGAGTEGTVRGKGGGGQSRIKRVLWKKEKWKPGRGSFTWRWW